MACCTHVADAFPMLGNETLRTYRREALWFRSVERCSLMPSDRIRRLLLQAINPTYATTDIGNSFFRTCLEVVHAYLMMDKCIPTPSLELGIGDGSSSMFVLGERGCEISVALDMPLGMTKESKTFLWLVHVTDTNATDTQFRTHVVSELRYKAKVTFPSLKLRMLTVSRADDPRIQVPDRPPTCVVWLNMDNRAVTSIVGPTRPIDISLSLNIQ